MSRPNILIFMTDQQQGATLDLGHPCRTPHLDRFAAEGIRFSRAYTPTALCAPARASFMTSLYPTRHGMLNNPHVAQAIRKGLAGDFPHFSERLKEAGYRMSYCGKWHVSEEKSPRDHGWEEADAATQNRLWGGWPGGKVPASQGYWLKRPGYDPYLLYGTPDCGPEEFTEHAWTQYAIGRLGELAKGTEPWCLYLGIHGPHDPYVAPPEFVRAYDPAKVPRPASFHDPMSDKPAVYRRWRHEVWGELEWEQYAGAIAHYWAYVSFIDDLFGQVLAALEAAGRANDTLVLFTSDHGDMMGGHGLLFKGVPAFEECYRIPMLARLPGVIPAGTTCGEFVSLIDVGPTLIELGGGRPFEESHGRSAFQLLQGNHQVDWPQEFLGQFHGTELLYSQRILTTKRYKYVFNGFDFDELYDLEADPHEMRNLYSSSEHRHVLEDMIRRLWRRSLAVGDTISCHGYPTTDLVPIGPKGGSASA